MTELKVRPEKFLGNSLLEKSLSGSRSSPLFVEESSKRFLDETFIVKLIPSSWQLDQYLGREGCSRKGFTSRLITTFCKRQDSKQLGYYPMDSLVTAVVYIVESKIARVWGIDF